jgi:hypothetical protein
MAVFFDPASQTEKDREEIVDDLVACRESDLQYDVEEQVEDYRSDLEDMSDAELAAEYSERYGEILELKEVEEDSDE